MMMMMMHSLNTSNMNRMQHKVKEIMDFMDSKLQEYISFIPPLLAVGNNRISISGGNQSRKKDNFHFKSRNLRLKDSLTMSSMGQFEYRSL